MLARENACKRNFLRFPVGEAPAQATAAVCDRRRPWLSATDACRLRPCRTPVAAIGALWRQLATVVGADGWRRQSPPTVAADSRRRQSPPTVAADSRRRQSPPAVAADSSTFCNFHADQPTAESHGRFSRPTPQALPCLCPPTVGGDCRRRLSAARLVAGCLPRRPPSATNYRSSRQPPRATTDSRLGRLLSANMADGFCGQHPPPPAIGGRGRQTRWKAPGAT